MADTDMTTIEAESFLADLHVGILSIARDGKGPLALPIWYRYEGGEVIISMSDTSTKTTLLRRHGRASLTVQQEAPPYKYVMVEGPVTVTPHDPTEHGDTLGMATRYLGEEMGAWYAEQNPPGDHTVTARLRPDRWLTCDYAKVL
ncbi:MAG: PPOX class probable F420-dependent enzyme [Ilumatobacter sp.]|jgi:PPOX class probable F420-dependent enzyme